MAQFSAECKLVLWDMTIPPDFGANFSKFFKIFRLTKDSCNLVENCKVINALEAELWGRTKILLEFFRSVYVHLKRNMKGNWAKETSKGKEGGHDG